MISIYPEAANEYDPGRILSSTDQAMTMMFLGYHERGFGHNQPLLLLHKQSLGDGWIQTVDTSEVLGFVISCPDLSGKPTTFVTLDFSSGQTFTGTIVDIPGLGSQARPCEIADIRIWEKQIFQDCEVRPLSRGEQIQSVPYQNFLPIVEKYLAV